jgi:hypothetical protein
VKYAGFLLKKILGLLYIFIAVFISCFTAICVMAAIKFHTVALDYADIAKDSAVRGLCYAGAVAVVLPTFYCIQHYIWPVLKFIGLKIRYFFHGY